MAICPRCDAKLGRFPEDEWPECSCGWSLFQDEEDEYEDDEPEKYEEPIQ